ncbi:uncharacterized protein LOC136029438 [Artemia franciscana]|uniref:uncharacterized protein LOC136029438 n=1 Tax=Artemia franciscana TaxID=6661 RepID=UPI0032DBB55E
MTPDVTNLVTRFMKFLLLTVFILLLYTDATEGRRRFPIKESYQCGIFENPEEGESLFLALEVEEDYEDSREFHVSFTINAPYIEYADRFYIDFKRRYFIYYGKDDQIIVEIGKGKRRPPFILCSIDFPWKNMVQDRRATYKLRIRDHPTEGLRIGVIIRAQDSIWEKLGLNFAGNEEILGCYDRSGRDVADQPELKIKFTDSIKGVFELPCPSSASSLKVGGTVLVLCTLTLILSIVCV